MKKTFLFLYTLLVFSGVYAQENKVKVEPVNGDKISLFSLKEVRLLDSDFKHIPAREPSPASPATWT